MKNNDKILYISIAILVLAVGIAFGTYAYYQTTISGTITGNVARWSFTANGQTSSVNLDLGNLYPGVSGTYYIELSAEDSELDVYYEIFNEGMIAFKDNNGQMVEEYWPPSILYWNLDEDAIWSCTVQNKQCKAPIGKYGTIPAGEKITIPLYLNWPYDNSLDDEEIIADGLHTYVDSFEIIGQQLTGYTGTTPLKLIESLYGTEILMYSDQILYSNGEIYATDDLTNGPGPGSSSDSDSGTSDGSGK